MKKNIFKNLCELLNSKMILAISSGLILASCGTQMGGYSETDGVYYNPEKDTLPEGVVMNDEGNSVGEYYDYQDSTYVDQNVRSRDWQENSKYWEDNSQNSDWGNYAGSETNFNNWGWNSFGYWNSPFYWRSGLSFGMNWGWYDPFWSYGYSPYWGFAGSYNPYWGWNSPYYGGYGSYYGGYNPYYYGYSSMYPYYRSGANGRLYNSYQNGNKGGLLRQGTSNNGFRNQGVLTSPRTQSQQGINNNGFRNPGSSPRPQNQQGVNNNGFRNPQIRNNTPQQNTPRNTTPRNVTPRSNDRPTYQTPQRSPQPTIRSNDNGGFRSGGGFNGGSSSGGGSRSGGSSSGSSRSGGFR